MKQPPLWNTNIITTQLVYKQPFTQTLQRLSFVVFVWKVVCKLKTPSWVVIIFVFHNGGCFIIGSHTIYVMLKSQTASTYYFIIKLWKTKGGVATPPTPPLNPPLHHSMCSKIATSCPFGRHTMVSCPCKTLRIALIWLHGTCLV